MSSGFKQMLLLKILAKQGAIYAKLIFNHDERPSRGVGPAVMPLFSISAHWY